MPTIYNPGAERNTERGAKTGQHVKRNGEEVTTENMTMSLGSDSG